MRFEHAAAYGMGVVLPLLEIARRRTNFHPVHAYVDDLLAGALLLLAARSVSRGSPRGPAYLAGAWGVLAGGLYGSFFWQLSQADEVDVGGSAGLTVVIVKGVLYAISVVALVLSIRRSSSAAV